MMNKNLLVIISLILVNAFVGCEGNGNASLSEIAAEKVFHELDAQYNKRILIAYFTMPERDGVDALAGASRIVENGTVKGNIEWIADRVLERTGGDQFQIETVLEYPENHRAIVDQGTIEKAEKARPELRSTIPDMDEYDVVFIGYPIWWADLPMPLYSFLEGYDFSGKKIIPFSSHGGSRLSGTVETLKRELPGSEVVENAFTVSRDSVKDSRESVIEWLSELGY